MAHSCSTTDCWESDSALLPKRAIEGQQGGVGWKRWRTLHTSGRGEGHWTKMKLTLVHVLYKLSNQWREDDHNASPWLQLLWADYIFKIALGCKEVSNYQPYCILALSEAEELLQSLSQLHPAPKRSTCKSRKPHGQLNTGKASWLAIPSGGCWGRTAAHTGQAVLVGTNGEG